MPNRILRETVTTSDSIDRLSAGAECFFYRLLTVVDDYGRLDARPSVLRAKCFPLRLDRISDATVAAYMAELTAAEMVLLYIVGRGRYLQLVNWERYRAQGRRASKSKYPDPSGDSLADPRKSAEILSDPPVNRDIESRDIGISTHGDAGATHSVGSPTDEQRGDGAAAPGVSRQPDVFEARVPRRTVFHATLPSVKTARDGWFRRIRERHAEIAKGQSGDLSEAGREWNRYDLIPLGEEEAVLAALENYARSDELTRCQPRSLAKFLRTWRDFGEVRRDPKAKVVAPGTRDESGQLRVAV